MRMPASDAEETKICRICLQDDEPADMIAPCMCRGSSKWVHRSCLDQWRIHERDRAFSQCTECGFTYHMQAVGGEDDGDARWRRIKFRMLVSRDILLVTLTLQLIICFLGWIIYLADSNNVIVDFFDGNQRCDTGSFFWCNHVWSAYYLCGLFFMFVLLGCYGCTLWCSHGCNVGRALAYIQDQDVEAQNGSYVAADHGTSWDNLQPQQQQQQQQHRRHPRQTRYVYQRRRNEDCCDDCCYACCYGGRRGGGFHYYYCPSCDCNCCENCDCPQVGRGGDNDSGECGREKMHILLLILLAVAIIMAVIGFFVGLVIAVVIGQRIIQRHVFLLHKRRLVREFIVKDLEEYGGVIPTAPLDRGEDPVVSPTAPPEYLDTRTTSTYQRVAPSAPHEMHDNDIQHLKKLGLMV